jgi:flagellar biosynthesis GTPase FlhF
MALPRPLGNLVAFPRADLRHLLGAAMKHHRLPENLAHALVRAAANFPEVCADVALACALAQRLVPAPIDFEKARGILLVGPAGSGKSAVGAKIARSAKLIGRRVAFARADGGLALFRTRSVRESGSDNKAKSVRESGSDNKTDWSPPELLTVMEADGFNPLNARAASAFSALGDIEGVQTIGVVSALNDAEDTADIVNRFRFRRVIVTGLDRTRRLGALMAASLSGARLTHVTYGPRPEDGLHLLEPGALAAQLLEITTH